jgi:peptidoglycan hydrolase-like protein with peptidoglycan-binding domain
VQVDGKTARVNMRIQAVAQRCLEELSRLSVDFPDDIPSFDPAGTDAQKIGISFRLPLQRTPEVAETLTRWRFKGRQVGNGAPEFVFTGTPAEATELGDAAATERFAEFETEEVSGPSPYRWPGYRDILPNDTGQDVAFLQLLLGAKQQDGRAGDDLFRVVRRFQEMRGGAKTGAINAELWARIIPRKLPTLYSGETGFLVRVLQAGLAAQELTTTRVTGVWGTLTTKDVRQLQRENGLQTRQFIRDPEWSLILGPQPWFSHYVETPMPQPLAAV